MLAKKVTQTQFEAELGREGLDHLRSVRFTFAIDSLDIKKLTPSAEVVKLLDLLDLAAGAKFTSHSTKEASESLVLGVASSLTPQTFHLASFGLYAPYIPPPLIPLSPSSLNPIFDPSIPLSTLFNSVSRILAPPTNTIYGLLTSTALSPASLSTRVGLEGFTRERERVEKYLDGIWVEVLNDERLTVGGEGGEDGGVQERVWGVLSRVFSVELWLIGVGLAVECYVDKLQGGRNRRFDLGYARMVRKLGLLLGHSKTMSEVFYILHLLTTCLDTLGPALADAFETIPVWDQEWLLRAFRFAGFWDAQAGKLVDTLMERRLAADMVSSALQVVEEEE
ncbi:hypothetical protein MNV49_001909 [Pseudohyphozyma bogoriensis]|nr:hypothetical protein MNV49_001909 [Pseudohyphozyma bogoriensis]